MRLSRLVAPAAVCIALGACATDPLTGKVTLDPAAKAIAQEIALIGWPVACAEAEAAFTRVKHPSSQQSAGMAAVIAVCSNPAPTDIVSAQASLAQAAAAFTTSLVTR